MGMGAGGLGVLVFSMIGPLSKRFDERLLLLGLGILPMIIGRSIMFPLTGDHAPIDCLREDDGWLQDNEFLERCAASCPEPEAEIMLRSHLSENSSWYNMTTHYTSTTSRNPWLSDDVDTSLVRCNGAGCSYDWCNDMPRISIAQF